MGHATVTLPCFVILFGIGLPLFLLTKNLTFGKTAEIVLISHFVRMVACELLAFVAAWTWWLKGVRRWRRWTASHAVDAEKTEKLAVRTCLVWPNRRFEGRRGKRGSK